jgi:peptide/nickel transport system ATP-binding protein
LHERFDANGGVFHGLLLMPDRVVIMYLGRVVESAPSDAVFTGANHPYTQALLASAPQLEARKTEFFAVNGKIPSPPNPPSGCHLHPRCVHAMLNYSAEKSLLREVSSAHFSGCHLNDQH